MARLKSPAKPARRGTHPSAHRWVASGIRLEGLRLLPADPPALRMAWSVAWRQYEQGQGARPISDTLFLEAIAAWPNRVAYPAIVDAWLAERAGPDATPPAETAGATP